MKSVTVTEVECHRTPHPSRRGRSLSLSLLVTARGASNLLEDLPSEVVQSILELSLLTSKPSTLATLSKALQGHLTAILYRTVVLATNTAVSAFYRTAISTSTSYTAAAALAHVRKLVVCGPAFQQRESRQVAEIVKRCGGVRSLVAPSLRFEGINRGLLNGHAGLAELTLKCFDSGDEEFEGEKGERMSMKAACKTLTRLRVGEPGSFGWVRPLNILEALGNPPHLTHLQLSRKTNSNEENDTVFAEDVDRILKSEVFKNVQMVVVSVFNGEPWRGCDGLKESNIWRLLEEIRAEDERLVLCQGEWGSWGKEWETVLPGESIDSPFWRIKQV